VASDERGRVPPALVPVLVFVGLVVAVVGSLGAPLVPTVARIAHVSLAAAQWSLTITLLVGAVTTPVLGRLGDGPHRRGVILTAIGVVVAGCTLAALPVGFAWLLAGRALQGVGLGLVPLAMATARDALPPPRAAAAIGVLSVTAVGGIGLAYPLAGLVTEAYGVRAAYAGSAAVTAAALVAAALVVPPPSAREPRPLDVPGAVLLGVAVAALLIALGQGESWGWRSRAVLGTAAGGLLVLAVWVRQQRRAAHPLVDLRLLRHPAVLTADVTIAVGGAGMYLLLALVARYVQTPASAGYGFDSSVVVAGAVLVPFSVASFLAGRVAPALSARLGSARLLAVGFAVVVAGIGTFLAARDRMWEVLLTMTVAGFGVGLVFAANPGLLVSGVPATETGSALALNQVLRNVGFSVGSAAAGAVLAAATPAGRALPRADGYRTAALLAVAVCVAALVISLVMAARGSAGRDRGPD